MTTTFEKLYKLAEGISSNEEQYMPQPFGDDPEHKSSMDPVGPEPLEISQPKEDGNQFTGSKKAKVECPYEGMDTAESLENNFGYREDYPHCAHCNRTQKSWRNLDRDRQGCPCESCFDKVYYSSKKIADISNTDENPSPGDVMAPKSVYRVNVEDPPEQQLFGDAGETSRGDGSISMLGSTINPEARKIVHAYVAENGTPKCSVCQEYYTPKTIAEAKLAHCGHCPEDNPDANKIEEGDVVDGDVIKTSLPDFRDSKLLMDGYGPKKASRKFSNDSELYTRGFLDHLHGKPLDEDLAVLSDDYFNGYDQARYYGKTPLESVGAQPHKVTIPASPDNSLDGWESIDRIDHKYDIDRSQIIASTLPTNVLEAFFDTEE